MPVLADFEDRNGKFQVWNRLVHNDKWFHILEYGALLLHLWLQMLRDHQC